MLLSLVLGLNALACGPLFGLVRRVRTKNTAAQRALKP